MLRAATVLLVAFTALLGAAYPTAVTVVAQALFAGAAHGSLVTVDGQAVGADRIGQPFTSARYFWGRPSATGTVPYDGSASGGSNQGPSSPALADAVRQRIAALRASGTAEGAPIPVDLVTASGSGLDPDLSPAAARFQVERVARARGLPPDEVRALVTRATEPPVLGILGAPRVNVLRLNLALDAVGPR